MLFWTLSAVGVAAETLPEPARESEEVTARTTKRHPLVLGLRYGNPEDATRLYERTHKLLTLLSCFDEFDCRLAGEVLMCERAAELVADGPFEDMLLGCHWALDNRPPMGASKPTGERVGKHA